MTCPNECKQKIERVDGDVEELKIECKENHDNYKIVMFGKDGRTGVVGCLTKFMTKRTAAWTLVTILSLTIGLITYSMNSFAKDKEKLAKTETDVAVVKADVEDLQTVHITLKRNQKEIQEAVDKLQHSVEKIEEKQMTPVAFKKLMKEATREVIVDHIGGSN